VTFSRFASATPGAAAYACSRLGFRVFPLRADTGTPAFAEWPERATLDADLIREWWTGNFSRCGVGIATGPESGTWVLDIDVKDADGFATLRDLTQRHGGTVDAFTRTMTVRTPSGGAHVYFAWDEASGAEGGVRNSSKQLAPGLDVRGIRGYVRAPEVGAYRLIERDGRKITTLASAPEWLIPLCKKRRNASAEPMTNADVRARMGAGGARWAKYEAAESVRKLARSAPGSRNDMLNRTAFRLGTLAALYGEPSEDAARAWCFDAMDAAGANDSREQQMRTFTSGWEAGRAAQTAKAVDHAPVRET
jgi:putative DNA primase/helicase